MPEHTDAANGTVDKSHPLLVAMRKASGTSRGKTPADWPELREAMHALEREMDGPPKGEMTAKLVEEDGLPYPTARIAPMLEGSGCPSSPFTTVVVGHEMVDVLHRDGVIGAEQLPRLHAEVSNLASSGLPWSLMALEAEEEARNTAAAADLRRKIEDGFEGINLGPDFESDLLIISQALGIPVSAIKMRDITSSMIPLGLDGLLDGPFGDLLGPRRSRRRTWRDDLGGDDDTPPSHHEPDDHRREEHSDA